MILVGINTGSSTPRCVLFKGLQKTVAVSLELCVEELLEISTSKMLQLIVLHIPSPRLSPLGIWRCELMLLICICIDMYGVNKTINWYFGWFLLFSFYYGYWLNSGSSSKKSKYRWISYSSGYIAAKHCLFTRRTTSKWWSWFAGMGRSWLVFWGSHFWAFWCQITDNGI